MFRSYCCCCCSMYWHWLSALFSFYLSLFPSCCSMWWEQCTALCSVQCKTTVTYFRTHNIRNCAICRNSVWRIQTLKRTVNRNANAQNYPVNFGCKNFPIKIDRSSEIDGSNEPSIRIQEMMHWKNQNFDWKTYFHRIIQITSCNGRNSTENWQTNATNLEQCLTVQRTDHCKSEQINFPLTFFSLLFTFVQATFTWPLLLRLLWAVAGWPAIWS